MITAELNTALADDEVSSAPPEVSFETPTDDIEAEDCYQAHQRAVERGNVCAKDRIRLAACLGRYLDAIVKPGGRRSRDGTAGRFTGAERVLPAWATKQQRYRWSLIGEVPDGVREDYFARADADEDVITNVGLFAFYAKWKHDQEQDIDGDEGGVDEERDDDEETDDDEDSDHYPTQRTLTLVLSVGEARVFDANREQVQKAALAAVQRLTEEATNG